MNRDVQQLVKKFERRGLVVIALRGGHYRVTTRSGRYLATFPSTPSCWRAIQNCEADVRRALRQGTPKGGRGG